MPNNEKQLKITSVFDTRGAEKVTKATEDLRKLYDQLGRSIKDVQKSLSDLDGVQKRNTDVIAKETEVLRQQVEQLKALRQAHLGVAQAAGGYGGMGYRTQGPSPAGYGGTATYGSIPGSRRGFSQGADTSPYAFNRTQHYMGIAARLGGIGAGIAGIGGLAAGAMGAYGDWLQHSGNAMAHEKSAGMEGLAGASAYRNHVFMESRTAPAGYAAVRNAHVFNLKTKDSERIRVGADGRLIQPGEAGNRSVTGGNFVGDNQDMTGEMRAREGAWMNAAKGGVAGLGKVIGGGLLGAAGVAGLMAAPVAGAFTGGLGALAAGAAGVAGISGGASMATGGVKEIINAIWGVHHEEKKEREGQQESAQDANAIKSEKLMDEVLAITRYQMGVHDQRASTRLNGGRSTLGGFHDVPYDFDLGEALSISAGARRGYGRGGAAGQGSIFDARRRGMSAEAATEIVGTFGQEGNGGQQLKNLMAAAVKSGMESLDMGFFEKLGTAAAQNAYGSQGLRDPSAAAAMFAGLYKPNKYDVQEQIGGAKGANDLFRNNHYFRSRGLVDASRILGNDATGLKIRTLNNASFEDLLGGSEALNSLNVTAEQREAMRQSRINNLGDTLGDQPEIAGMLGGGDFSHFLQTLAGDLKDPKKRAAAKKKLNLLATAAGGLTGMDFGTMRGALRGFGVSTADMAAFGKGGDTGKFKYFQDGADIVAHHNRTTARDDKSGGQALADVETARHNWQNEKFQQEVMSTPEGHQLQQDLNQTTDPKRAAAAARKMNLKFSEWRGKAAQNVGEGYDSGQKLSEQLGQMSDLLQRGVNKELKDMALNLKIINERLERMKSFR
jgi:hypothetical protein